MSIALIVTAGFGNGTLSGTVADVVTRGYTIGAILSAWTIGVDTTTTWTEETNTTTTWTEETNTATVWTVEVDQ